MQRAKSKLLCRSCDLVVQVPPYKKGVTCICPQCKSELRSGSRVSLYNLAVVSIASVIMLFTAVSLPFMTISSLGISQSMSLTSIVFVLHRNWSLLVALFLLFTFCCPLIMHLIVIGIVFFKLTVTRRIANLYSFCHRFCMVDVFILGVMVSLIKLVSLADISFHPGFISAVIFAMLMVWCYSHGSPYTIWNLVREHDEELRSATVGMRGIDQGLIMCRHCGMVYKRKGRKASKIGQEIESSNLACDDDDYLYRGEQVCPRCGHSNDHRSVMMYQKTAALLLAAVILYIPSNVYPIMFTNYLGSNLGSDILDGVIALWEMHSYFVSSVILIASICIPIAKILCILLLLYITKHGFKGYPSRYNKLYRIILFIGRWSMIDVFVVIIMSTVVRMSVLTISPGIAVVFFCFTVLVTMLAAEEYDERLLWDKALAKRRDSIINKDGELIEAPIIDDVSETAAYTGDTEPNAAASSETSSNSAASSYADRAKVAMAAKSATESSMTATAATAEAAEATASDDAAATAASATTASSSAGAVHASTATSTTDKATQGTADSTTATATAAATAETASPKSTVEGSTERVQSDESSVGYSDTSNAQSMSSVAPKAAAAYSAAVAADKKAMQTAQEHAKDTATSQQPPTAVHKQRDHNSDHNSEHSSAIAKATKSADASIIVANVQSEATDDGSTAARDDAKSSHEAQTKQNKKAKDRASKAKHH